MASIWACLRWILRLTRCQSQKAATRALEIDDREGEALSVLACTKAMFEWDWCGAETLFRKALDANPEANLRTLIRHVCAIADGED